MRWNIIVECVEEDGRRSTITLGTIERLAASTTAENLGVNLEESKRIANRLQDTVVKQQLQEHCEQRRKCPTCGKKRPVKDFRRRRLDTVLGTVRLRVPRYRGCQCCSGAQIWSPIPEVFSGRVTPELLHLQVSLGAQISYRKAAALLRMFLPPMGGTTHTTNRSRVHAVGERIDEQIQREIAENRKPDKPADQMIIGIDGAFVKGRPPTDRASQARVQSTVDQLVDWRMEKKQHMRWTRTGAQMLLHARCALINGELGKYTGWSPTDSSLEQAVAA
jgi:hypothetical protein